MGGGGKGGVAPPQPELFNGIGTYEQYLQNGGLDSSANYYAANPGAPGAPPAAFAFPEFAFPDFGAQQADYAKQLKAAEEDRRVTQGQNDRDSLFGDYMSAAGSATDFINSQIKGERSNARLLGVDYNITDDQKSTRISDYFASIWGEGDQSRLEGLMGEFGDPEGFTGFAIARGDGSNVPGAAGNEKGVGTTTATRPSIVGGDEEDELGILGSTSILGG